MRELPELRALARSKPGQVLKLWEGLGYINQALMRIPSSQSATAFARTRADRPVRRRVGLVKFRSDEDASRSS